MKRYFVSFTNVDDKNTFISLLTTKKIEILSKGDDGLNHVIIIEIKGKKELEDLIIESGVSNVKLHPDSKMSPF